MELTNKTISSAMSPRSLLGLRHVYANLVLFACYCSVSVLLIWIDSSLGQSVDSPMLVVIPAFFLSAIPAFCVLNWRLTASTNRYVRLAVGILIGLLIIGLALVPFGLVLRYFQDWLNTTGV